MLFDPGEPHVYFPGYFFSKRLRNSFTKNNKNDLEIALQRTTKRCIKYNYLGIETKSVWMEWYATKVPT